MKLTQTKIGSKSKLIDLGDGLFIRRLSMQDMLDHFEGLKDDTDVQMINKTFDRLVVDENGDKFEDLIKKKATDVLPVDTISVIMEAIVGAMTPDPKA